MQTVLWPSSLMCSKWGRPEGSAQNFSSASKQTMNVDTTYQKWLCKQDAILPVYLTDICRRILTLLPNSEGKVWLRPPCSVFPISLIFNLLEFPLASVFIPLELQSASFLTASFHFSSALPLYLNEASPPQWLCQPKEQEHDKPGTYPQVPRVGQSNFLI